MAKFDLQKAQDRVKFVVAKRKLPAVKAQVAFDLDVSGSMRDMFASGVVQEAVQRVLPVALQFDDNGALDMFTFSASDMIAQPEQVTVENYDGYVEREIVRNARVPKWSGTSYAPVIERNLDSLGFRNEKRSGGFFGIGGKRSVELCKGTSPAVVYFITDGENDDQARTTELLRACQVAGSRIYVLFMGIGTGSSFDYLKQVADDFGNTGFLNVNNLARFVDRDDLYEQLLPEELCEWLKA